MEITFLSRPKQSKGNSRKFAEICKGVEPPVLEARTFVLYAEKIAVNVLMMISRALSNPELKAFSTALDERYVAIAI